MLAFFCNNGLPFLATFLVARILTIDDFGQFIATISLFTTVLLVVDLGLSIAATTRIARQIQHGEAGASGTVTAAFLGCFVLGSAASVLIFAFAGSIDDLLFAKIDLKDFLLAGTVFIPATALASVAVGSLQGAQRYRELALFSLIAGVTQVTLVVVLAKYAGSLAALWGMAFSMVLRAVLLGGAAVSVFGLKLQPVTRSGLVIEIRNLIAISVPASIAAASFAPVHAFLMTVLLRAENGNAEAGAFGLALQAFSVAMVVPGIMTQFALPKLSAQHGEHAHRDRLRLVFVYAGVSLISALTICAPLGLLSASVMSLFGAGYEAHREVFTLMMLAAVFSAPQGVFSNYILAIGRNWHRVFLRYLWASVVVVAFLVATTPTAQAAARAYCLGWLVLVMAQIMSIVYFHAKGSRESRAGTDKSVDVAPLGRTIR